ncbi:bifunctional metallophosphatase/5'-nucleotidase [Gracilibacillus alcaliphilus]|uniref:bifunctional metallophosphatase/5'-nucleotidase n=1 Tax=Gracilibacillus alcaliphilus TaxID=1401441 RepID=UPI00195C9783|nr:bifunctional UDP-sugar hydrolase/5'-nucleotidase [Gracilibacillus alcaliphilus]MBM7679229.1 2',3'-cyclic-nucleotide 2'-phosphodiesterase/3'-nucleotidase [Gracilibacillus alcaliphilus]
MKKQKIVILFTSDVHGKISPYNSQDKSYDGKGYAKVSSIIKSVREQEEYVIVLDNGDMLQGTPLSHFALVEKKKETIVHPVIAACNKIQYDAAVIGNHEFNYGREKLEKAVRDSTFPWLSANTVKKGTEEPYFGIPYIIKKFGELTVGILGLTTKNIPLWEPDRHIDCFDFLDPINTAKKWVPYLKEELGADIVVIAYHGGFEQDPITGEHIAVRNGENQGNELLGAIPEINVLITGHQHLVYQAVTEDNKAVIQSGTKGEFVGRIDLWVEKKDSSTPYELVQQETSLLPVKDMTADEAVLSGIEDIEKEVDGWLDETLTSITDPSSMQIGDPLSDVWIKEHPMIEWVNKTFLKVTGADMAATAYFLTHGMAFGQTLTRRDMHTFYPFANTLVIMEVSGEEIRASLEFTNTFLTLDQNENIVINESWKLPRLLGYNYDMWEGIEYTVHLRKPEGKRITQLTSNGEPINPNKTYRVATSSYRASGTGGYDMFSSEKIIKEFPFGITEMLIEELENTKEFIPTANQNWKVVK